MAERKSKQAEPGNRYVDQADEMAGPEDGTPDICSKSGCMRALP